MSTPLLITLALTVAALAAPQYSRATPVQSCDISDVPMNIPPAAFNFTLTTSSLSFVTLGVGLQNYTCSNAGTYTSIGAIASLFDLSCLSHSPEFEVVQDVAFALWEALAENAYLPEFGQFLGNHYFINSSSVLTPEWDFRAGAAKGIPDAFVLGQKIADAPAPTGPDDVDWLQLKSISGSLATQIYRTDTRGGSPPTSCTPGTSPISLKYVAKYWLYGGNVTIDN